MKAEGVCEGESNCLKYLKRRVKQKIGKKINKDLKNGGGQARPRGGCLKNGGLGPPYKLWTKRWTANS